MSGSANDIKVRCKYYSSVRWGLHLWIYKDSWRKYAVHRARRVGRGRYDHPIRQTTICLEASGDQGTSPFHWYYGVRAGQVMANMDETRCGCLVTNLQRAVQQEPALDRGHWFETDWGPVRCRMDQRWRDWRRLFPRLLDECQSGVGGGVTDHYVSCIVAFAKIAIPVIDRTEAAPHGTA